MDEEPEINEEIKQANDEFIKIASAYHTIFLSDQGKIVLKDLSNICNTSHLSANVMMDSQANVNPSEFMFLREGQDSFLRYIFRMIKIWEDNK